MTAQVIRPGTRHYGATELKKSYQTHLIWAALLAALLHAGLLGGLHMFRSEVLPAPIYLPPRITDTVIIEIDRFNAPPPEPITNTIGPVAPPVAVVGVEGIPKPIRDALVDSEVSLQTIAQRAQRYAVKVGTGTSGQTTGEPGLTVVSEVPPPETFISCEKLPVAYKKVPPIYPPLALATGLQARLTIRAYIDERGNVADAIVAYCSAPGMGFEESALKAVRQWHFRPAIQNGKPIGVWTNLPFFFRAE